jgi:hypothetical protein
VGGEWAMIIKLNYISRYTRRRKYLKNGRGGRKPKTVKQKAKATLIYNSTRWGKHKEKMKRILFAEKHLFLAYDHKPGSGEGG